MKLLLAEDDIKLGALVKSLLEFSGFETEWARDGREALERIREAAASSYDVVILDWMLPEISGIEICRLLRNPRKYNYQGGIIFLTARDGTDDCVTGLESGADDYLVKPFGTSELLARIRTAIRHTRTTLANSQIAQSGKFTAGDLTIDYDKHQVLIRGENAKLTVNEYKIVALLGKYAGKVLTYDFIIRELWGPKAKADNQILRVNMANIRRKIEETPGQPQYIFTEVGVGYRMREGD